VAGGVCLSFGGGGAGLGDGEPRSYWTTRIIVPANAKLVRRGPYKFIRHPNYCVVIAEIALLPLALGSWPMAILFSLVNAVLLTWRIRMENVTLRTRRQPA
jgi:methyltransferase